MSEIDVSIDSNEKAETKEYFVSSFINDGIKPEIIGLPAGDFLIYGKEKEKDSILFERKDASDLVSSIRDGRIWEQMAKMKESGVLDRRVLIEGDPLKSNAMKYGRRVSPSQIYGTYEGILNWGAKIIWVSDIYQSSAYLRNLIHRKERPKKYFTLRASPSRNLSLYEKKLYFLQGLPGIGGKGSRDLLKHFGSIDNIIKNVDKIDDVRGIGKKTKNEIKIILETN